MTIGNLTIDGNLFLAPLAGISNRPFRLLARRCGASLCYTEMVSADAIVMAQAKTLRMIDIRPDDHPVGIQLFGSKPDRIAGAVGKVLEFKPDLIDLNLGCPVKKVVKKNGGAALLKDLNLTGEIMAAAVENSTVPVTIKIRTGWDSRSDVYLEVGKAAEKLGVAAITLHPRSRTQDYGVRPDWSKIRHLKGEVSIPVIGNGDVKTPVDARDILTQTGCDAIMIGRAAMRNPFIFKQISTYLTDGRLLPDPTVRQTIDLALEHSRQVIEEIGEGTGVLMMRKHLAWYSNGFRGGAELRRKLKAVVSYADIHTLLHEYLNAYQTMTPE